MALGPNQIAGIAQGATGLAAVIGGALYGGIKTRNLNRQYDSMVRGRLIDNEQWHNIKQSQEYTRRSDVQAENTKLRELLEKTTARDRAINTVAGGTDQSLAASRAAANGSLAQAYADAAARASEYNDRNEREYREQDSAIRQQMEKNLQQRSASVAQAASQVVNSGLKLFGDSFDTFSSSPIGKTNA